MRDESNHRAAAPPSPGTCTAADGRPGPSCPGCRGEDHLVSRRTVEAITSPSHLAGIPPESRLFFCGTRTCDVLYYNAAGLRLGKESSRVRVGVKESGPPRTLCYCFNYTLEQVRDQIDREGATSIPEQIAEGIRAGRCDCERLNPSGRCCLAEVRTTVKRFSSAS